MQMSQYEFPPFQNSFIKLMAYVTDAPLFQSIDGGNVSKLQYN